MHASDSPQPSTSGCDGNASSSHDPQLRLHKLLVQKLQPAHAASVIDTEVEAEVVPSVEAERYLAEREAQEKERAVREEAERQRLAVLAVQRAAEEQVGSTRGKCLLVVFAAVLVVCVCGGGGSSACMLTSCG